jgi:VTC domain
MAETFNLRETRWFAREIKFLIDPALFHRIREWARKNLAPDPNGVGEFSDEYHTTSLYFDTPKFDVFHGRGSYGRGKFRIRRYGTDAVIFLERKFRSERFLAKRRTAVSREEVNRLFEPESDPTWDGHWFHRRLLKRGLQPTCQVSYLRTARCYQSPQGLCRLTMDNDLRVLPMPDLAFIPGAGMPLMPDQVILEMKFRTDMPAPFKQVVEEFILNRQAVSKYKTGVMSLGYTPAGGSGSPEAIDQPVLEDPDRA